MMKNALSDEILCQFRIQRDSFLRANCSHSILNLLSKLGIDTSFSTGYGIEDSKWTDTKYHLIHRIHLNHKSTEEKFDFLFGVYNFSEEHKKAIKKITLKGIELQNGQRIYYDLSILPLNLLLGLEVIRYFVPPADYFELHASNQEDPYGIISGKSRSKGFTNCSVAIKSLDSKLLLGANKFTHTLLYNVDFYCPIGCSDCYKARMGTREYSSNLKKKLFVLGDIGEVIPPTKSTAIQQAQQTVMWMNHDERGRNVYDVIISGGEPLMLSNDVIKGILSEFKYSENLQFLRICTGVLFLGLPFRIDEDLLQIFRDFSDDTAVRITIQAHIGNHFMISPESIIAIQKIKKFGFSIYAQVPIKNGVNFFLSDPQRTLDELSLLMHKLVIADVEPYMLIVDMHPSTNEYYVPIEPLLQIWGELVESHDFPGLEKPRTLSILFEQGNVILSGNTLFAMKKNVDLENGIVYYEIPRVGLGNSWEGTIKEAFVYSEPLLKGINCDVNSLEKFSNRYF
jgi:L-lysine 2,3-aminomutase